MYTNNHLLNNMLPTVFQIKNYLKAANSDTKRDVRPLMSFLQRLPEVDPYLFGLILSRKRAIEAFKQDIRLPLEFKITPIEEKQLNETKIRFRRSRMSSVIDTIMDGILYGMSAARLQYTNTPLGTMVTKIIPTDLTELAFSETDHEELDFINTLDSGEFIRTPLDPDIYLYVRNNIIKNRKSYQGGHLRSIMLLSFLKYHNRWNWADNNERHGIPPTYASHPDNLTDDEVSKLVGMVEKLRKDSVAVFPDYVKILYENALKSDQTDSFEKFVSACNLEMAVNLHGQNLTTEVQSGSRAAADVHNEIDDLIISGDVKVIQNTLTQQYLRNDYLLNYGEPRNDFFEFVLYQDGQEDFESNSRIIANIFSDPEFKSKFPIKKSELYAKLGFTEPAEDDDVV